MPPNPLNSIALPRTPTLRVIRVLSLELGKLHVEAEVVVYTAGEFARVFQWKRFRGAVVGVELGAGVEVACL